MARSAVLLALAILLSEETRCLDAQVVLEGRLLAKRHPGSTERAPLSKVLVFASLDGCGAQALQCRTWESEPAGWYHLSGSAGSYTVLFSSPAHFLRPVVLTNVRMADGDRIDRIVEPRFTHAVFHEGAWDRRPGYRYWQTFIADGTSVTHVGFRLAADGVDGFGPGKQDLIVSIHRKGEGEPGTWPEIGPAVPVPGVDAGGAKNEPWSAGWGSGEAPTVPGETYAVSIRTTSRGGKFQPFWMPDGDPRTDCWRGGPDVAGWQGHDLWLAVGSDADGLLIPYPKRVHREFHELTRMARRWSQTYVARGRGLAGVILYAAVSGAQPPLTRQRCAVRVRRGGPAGPMAGIEKVAIGNGNYTGDASWGSFGAAFAPGEVPLEPGETYAIELESIENHETLHGFVNIKGQVSDGRPGFNPYRKHPLDDYPQGTAYVDGSEAVDFDLDMQVIEYEAAAPGWSRAVTGADLLENGGMESGDLDAADPAAGGPAGWRRFAIEPDTVHHYLEETEPESAGAEPAGRNRIARVIGGGWNGKEVDGGWVRKAGGLSGVETYRLAARVRSSWPVDSRHQSYIGIDPTGQDEDPRAPTIAWTALPPLHGIFVPYLSDPIRPRGGEISVWLRGRTTLTKDAPFKADFDDVSLRRVDTGVPRGR